MIAESVSSGIRFSSLFSETRRDSAELSSYMFLCVFYESQSLHAALKTEHTWIQEGEKVHSPDQTHT